MTDQPSAFMTGFDTAQEATSAALAQALREDVAHEGFTVNTCVCGRRDLAEMLDDELTATMKACDRCERIWVGPGGRA